MTIARPGRRLLRDIPLPFVARKVAGGGQRALNAPLSLTSMIDFLVVTVVFLLILFQPGQSAAANGTTLPDALNIDEMIDAPMISVSRSQILLDGAPVGNTRHIDDAHKLENVPELSRALVAKRETWKELHPEKRFPGAVVLQLDQDTSSVVVKSLFQTAAHAGYPAISFMVDRRDK
ncbi:MAG: biopolymer transporter ExbD [Labilithrix sp.]